MNSEDLKSTEIGLPIQVERYINLASCNMHSRKNIKQSQTPRSSLANSLRASHTMHSTEEENIFAPDLHLDPGKTDD